MAGKLRLDWSPEQIAGWLKRTYPEDECNQVSHETIYRSLFVQTRGVLKKELLVDLRSKRSMRRSKPVDPNGDRRGHIKDIVSIRQRPAAVEDRAVPGHWEGDLLSFRKRRLDGIFSHLERRLSAEPAEQRCDAEGLIPGGLRAAK